VGPGLVAEARYADAIQLLWQWDEGRELLSNAGDRSVTIETIIGYQFPFQTAHFRPGDRRIRVGHEAVDQPVWVIAAILAHELTHASDDEITLEASPRRSECLQAESRAYGANIRFVTWLEEQFGPLPSFDDASALLSPRSIAAMETFTSPDLATDGPVASCIAHPF
jgi:hypothetical protein